MWTVLGYCSSRKVADYTPQWGPLASTILLGKLWKSWTFDGMKGRGRQGRRPQAHLHVGIIERFGLEIIWFQPLCHGPIHHPLDQVAWKPIQLGLEANLQFTMAFGRGWISLFLNSQPVCRSEAHWCCEQKESVLPLPRLSRFPRRSQTLAKFLRIHFKTSPTKSHFFLDKYPLFQLVPPAGYQSS